MIALGSQNHSARRRTWHSREQRHQLLNGLGVEGVALGGAVQLGDQNTVIMQIQRNVLQPEAEDIYRH